MEELDNNRQHASTSKDATQRKGSGLALFFRDSLPPTDNVTYSTSLAEIPAAIIPEMDQGSNEENVVTTTPMMTYKEWRDVQKRLLMEFLGRRMTEERDGSSSDEEDNSSESYADAMQEERAKEDEETHYDASQTQPETQLMFETQDFRAEWEGDENNDNVSPENRPRKRRKKSRPKRVPHLEDTLHELSKLDFLDLYTQTLHLPLCRVLKVWNLRDTKRGAFTPFSGIARPCCAIEHAPMDRIPFCDLEEDGPISSAFRSVLSMEVEQLKVAEHSTTAGSQATKRMRIKMFFYNIYAEKIAAWMEKQRKSKRHEFFLNLSAVPAKCIFPRAIDPNSWLDQHDMVEYCICIGDVSSAKVVNDGVFIRFDDEELQVSMAPRSIVESMTDGESDHRPEDVLVLSKKSFDDDFLSGSEGSNQMKLATVAIDPMKTEWSKYISQYQSDSTANRNAHQEAKQNHGSLQQNLPRSQSQALASQNDQNENQTSAQATDLQPPDDEAFTVAPMKVVGSSVPQPHGEPKEYIKLGDLKGIRDKHKKENTSRGQTFNIYAVVLGFTAAAQTNRGDWKIAVTLVDPFYTTPVTLTMYFKRTSPLPNLARMGDVLRIHRAKLDDYKPDDIHLFSTRYQSGSYLVVRKTEQEEWKIFPTSLETFSFDPLDAERTQKLWLWGQDFIKTFPTMKPQHSFTLAEMNAINASDEEHLKDRDITVMIAGIFPYPTLPSGATPRGFLRVWDGTGIAPSDPYPVQTILTQHATGRGDPPPDALTKVVKVVRDMQATDPSMQTPLSFCGRVANAVIWEEKTWEFIKKHAPVGTFVRLRNVAISQWMDNPFRSLIVHDYTWLTPLPNQNFEVQALLKAHNNRVVRREYNPGAGLLPSDLNHGASRLKEFVDDEVLGEFTGPVYVKFVPDDLTREQLKRALIDSNTVTPIFLSLRDQSDSVMTMASEDFREKLLGIVNDVNAASIWNELLSPQKSFTANIRSVNWNDHRYFVLKDLT